MSALSKIEAAGFVVTLVDGCLDITPTKAALTDDQRSYIKTHKPEIIRQLSGTQLQQDIRDRIEERAAIMEYDSGLTRKDAEQAATTTMRVYCYRMKDKPAKELTVIMPGTELDEALIKMRNQYGDRLLDVYPNPYCITGIPVSTTNH